MIAILVYILCATTCWICAALLGRAYFTRRNRMLLWSALAFCTFGVGNLLLCADPLLPNHDLSLARNLVTLGGIALLLRGLIWEGQS